MQKEVFRVWVSDRTGLIKDDWKNPPFTSKVDPKSAPTFVGQEAGTLLLGRL